MNPARQKDVGFYVKTVAALAGTTVDSEVSTAWIDRRGFMSATLALACQPVLAEGETISFAGNWQDASDSAGSDAADYGDAVTTVTIQTGTTGTDPMAGLAYAAGQLKANLDHAKRYIRAQFTLTTSSSGTATYGATIVLGGADHHPIS